MFIRSAMEKQRNKLSELFSIHNKIYEQKSVILVTLKAPAGEASR